MECSFRQHLSQVMPLDDASKCSQSWELFHSAGHEQHWESVMLGLGNHFHDCLHTSDFRNAYHRRRHDVKHFELRIVASNGFFKQWPMTKLNVFIIDSFVHQIAHQPRCKQGNDDWQYVIHISGRFHQDRS